MIDVERSLGRNLSLVIGERFVEIATENLKHLVPSAHAHITMLDTLLPGDMTPNPTTCAICLARFPRYTLDCKHRLCNPCTLAHGIAVESWKIRVSICPRCRSENIADVALIPPTAGTRILSLQGSSPHNTWQFLRDLKRCVGLTSLPVREFFDGVIAADSGQLTCPSKDS
jgi:hypothetical protein